MTFTIDLASGEIRQERLLKGCLRALRAYPDLRLILVGDRARILSELGRGSKFLKRLEIIHTDQIIAMDEDPAFAVKSRPESSIVLATKTLSTGRSSGLFSPGNTGATITAASLLVGFKPGVSRGALGTVFPSDRGQVLLLDSGAGIDISPERYLGLAKLGLDFLASLYGPGRYRTGLLNIGVEPNKGTKNLKEAYRLLKEQCENFIGNIEPGDVFAGKADLVLCDGFVGNIFIKLCEGIGKQMQRVIKNPLRKRFSISKTNKISDSTERATRRSILRYIRKYTDPEYYGGAPLLGVNGTVLIGHGRSGPGAVYNAITLARALHKSQKSGGPISPNKSS